ncbi:hypothetical protein LWI29_006989 [Acer saccharum]|uniref:Uncharacterized protein n=1 Tax=Acer saccharum TaxID=4024 RepID=A0AA39V719_ACESA|nr:hypothetical protein LWI29_006989 [Acer saccharum]
MSNLSDIIMPNNNFEGPTPVEFCQLEYLEVLDLSENNLSGDFPSCLYSPYIQQVNLSRNKLQGQLKEAFYSSSYLKILDLSYNHFDGSIPKWIGRLSQLSYLILSNNNFDGEMPIQLCWLDQIHSLNLSHNKLTGPIPPSFSYLRQIESLDLSYNYLSGKIPTQLVELYNLAVFSVAHNNLTGKKPERIAQFGIFGYDRSEGNLLLCGLLLPKSCDATESPSSIPGASTEDGEDSNFMDMDIFYISFTTSYALMGARVEKILDMASTPSTRIQCQLMINDEGDNSVLVPGGIRIGSPAMTARGFTERIHSSCRLHPRGFINMEPLCIDIYYKSLLQNVVEKLNIDKYSYGYEVDDPGLYKAYVQIDLGIDSELKTEVFWGKLSNNKNESEQDAAKEIVDYLQRHYKFEVCDVKTSSMSRRI